MRGFFCDLQFHRQASDEPFEFGDALVFLARFRLALKDQGGVCQQLLFPPTQDRLIDVEIPADLRGAFGTGQNLQDGLRFELRFVGLCSVHGGLPF